MSFAREGELGEEPVQGMIGVCYAKVWQAALGIQSRQVKGREGTGPRQPRPVWPFLDHMQQPRAGRKEVGGCLRHRSSDMPGLKQPLPDN